MGNRLNGSLIGGSKRLALGLLVAFTLNATPILVEPTPAAQIASERTDAPRDTLDGAPKRADEKRDDDKKDTGGIGPKGEGSGY